MSIYDITPEMETMEFQLEDGTWTNMKIFVEAIDRFCLNCLEASSELPKA